MRHVDDIEEPDIVTPTIGTGGRRVWLYPKWIRGRKLTIRTAVHWVLIVLLLIGPWIDIGGHPATRIDIPGRRLYFWGMTFMATDGAYLLFFAGVVIFSVFLFTALYGRAWCGWSCPQTVFLESLIRPVERLIEGDWVARRKLDEAPWTGKKLVKKLTKWSFYLVVAGGAGTTFAAYFLGREGVLHAQMDPLSHPAGTATFLAITGALLFDFAWFREQVCLVVCPYGRFQSVLIDRDSLTVGYDVGRGEPRAKPAAKLADPSMGDCVDCRACVNVCPTGIDIRKGAQMECVQCMACIDACDSIMTKLNRPTGLVRLDSERRLNRSRGATPPSASGSLSQSRVAAIEGQGFWRRALRPRVIAYAVALTCVLVTAVFVVGGRQPVGLNLHRQAGAAPFVQLPDQRVQNSLELRIQNRTSQERRFTVELVGDDGTELLVPGGTLVVEPESTRQFPVFLVRSNALGDGILELRVSDDLGFSGVVEAEFIGRPGGGT
ncbi:cytochrome c oxidase accessory protein CcoG [Nannocystaceae bacterium ST9]